MCHPDARELGQKLASRNYPGLHLKTIIVPDGHHITALPGEISLGLVEAFALRALMTSVGLDAGKLDDLGPFLCFVDDQFAELGG
jgi:hypothetical protein